MPLYEFHCSICGFRADYVTSVGTELVCCPNCQGEARKQFAFGQSHPVMEEAGWYRSVLEVVDKESENAVDKEFLRHPNRTNYKKWMKYHGLRPMENEYGALPGKKEVKRDLKPITEYCIKKHIEGNRIEVARD